jgi:glycosyltransferase involved in cell wall biosynthesis
VPDDIDALAGIVESYRHIWSISAFTARWVKRYWGRDSDVIAPIVDVASFAPGIKRKQILSVGRFFSGTHNKKHLEMIGVFRDLTAQDLAGWELHLAGGTMPQPEHQAYLAQVRAAAQASGVQLHLDAGFELLRGLYAESSVYWHAAGYGEDEEREPIRFEHFGITTVEAMAAGCVPVVIDRGGQPEIVRDGHNGRLWSDLNGLRRATLDLAGDPALRERLAGQAIADSRQYDASHFARRLDALMGCVAGG